MQLRKYQEAGVEFLKTREFAILADEMGLGKTIQAIAATTMPRQAGSVIVVAPLITVANWRAEIGRWAASDAVVLDSGGKVAVPDKGWVIIPWTSVVKRYKDVFKLKEYVLILDECHRVKNKDALVTQATLGKWQRNKAGYTRTQSLAYYATNIWGLSGTPIPNRPVELQQLLHMGGLLPWANYRDYGERFCKRTNKFTRLGYDYLGANHLDELSGLLAPHLLRRTARDVPGELPELTVITMYMSGIKEPKIADELDAAAISEFIAGSGRAKLSLETLSRYRKEIGLEKVEQVAQYVREWVESNDMPIVVFAWHNEVAQLLGNKLADYSPLIVTGTTATNHRSGLVNKFIAGASKVFIGSIGVCGTGLNGLHNVTTHCVFAEIAWTPGELSQAIGRVRRVGGIASHATATFLVGDDTLETHIFKLVASKLSISNQVLN